MLNNTLGIVLNLYLTSEPFACVPRGHVCKKRTRDPVGGLHEGLENTSYELSGKLSTTGTSENIRLREST